jgi:hypothetical protein
VRTKIAVLIVIVAGVGFVVHERKSRLEDDIASVASQLAERKVHVHCQGATGELIDVGPELGAVPFDASGRPGDVTNLKRSVCTALRRFRADATSPRFECVVAMTECDRRAFDDVQAVKVLAHEVWHLRADADEAVTECHSLQTTAQAAQLLGADPSRAEAVAQYAWRFIYPNMPSDYRTTECSDGGPLDLRPADSHWP